MKTLLPFDIFTIIIDNINNIKDLHNFCAIGKDIKKYCEVHRKNIFINLMKKDNFKNDFYNNFNLILTDDLSSKFKNIKNLLKYYPIGEFSNNSIINEMQKDFLNSFYNLSDFNQHLLRNLFILLFFPSDYPDLSNSILISSGKLHELNEYLGMINNKYKNKNKLIDVYIYHLHNLKSEKKIHDLIKSLFENVLDEYHIEFMLKNITILKREFNLKTEYIDNIFNELLQN